jgi:hypothetical protein
MYLEKYNFGIINHVIYLIPLGDIIRNDLQ